MKEDKYIEIIGAKSHNLKDISLSIPRNKFVVITGLSGSGKSSLAFDTIYAEGQRRYMDTLSPYAKHFMTSLKKPDVEDIRGLSPIIAIEQKNTGNNPRSTVGTITEIYDFLRLLYAKASTAFSPISGKEMIKYSNEQIVELIISQYEGKRCYLLAPLVNGRKGHYKELFEQLRKRAYTQVRIDGKIEELADITSLDRYKAHFIELVVDKLKPSRNDIKRIRESLDTALNRGKGSIAILDEQSGELKHFSKHLVDPENGISLQEPAPHSFSFNSPAGYCPHCKGLGSIVNIDINSIIPDRSISIADGGIIPLGAIRETKKYDIIRAIAAKYNFSLYEPIDTLSDDIISLLIFGSEELFRVGQGAMSQMLSFSGLVEDIDDKIICPECLGTRLNKESKYFKIDNLTISEVSEMEISQVYKWVQSLSSNFNNQQNQIARDILKELEDRLSFLLNVGLDYLSLNRSSSSLSGGESQRIRLATQIGSKLVNVLYILDEPSIGLHQKDNIKLIHSLQRLRDEGNSVMVVEHDEETMRAADWLVDIGEGAGSEGGNICVNASIPYLLENKKEDKEDIKHFIINKSKTLDYLLHKNSICLPKQRRAVGDKFLSLYGASGNNLKNIDIQIPLGIFVCISGLSGSGKSSLINETLMPILKNHYHNAKLKPLTYKSIEGLENLDKLIEVDQSPIGRSTRSNPATFTGVFNHIRDLFAETAAAKIRALKPAMFSFNVKGGRCEACKGAGIQVIEMNFMPSVNVVCDECRGRRYKDEVLAVKYKGKSINEVLEMPIAEAYEFFKAIPKIAQKLKALVDVGLGYIKLGQSSVSLSGGESQRMKLAAELFKPATGNTLYILDEPTTGLHFEDIKTLINVLQKLVEQGNSIIVIEHNLDVLKTADYIFDMGPEGGLRGGQIVAQGSPEELVNNKNSVTGVFLKKLLE